MKRKRILSIFIAYIMVCTMIIGPAAHTKVVQGKVAAFTYAEITPFAADYFTGGTGKMNALYGGRSTGWNISSGTLVSNGKVSAVSLNVTVSTGSDPFYIVVVNPAGYSAQRLVSRSGTVSYTEFNTRDPKGTWNVYIYTTGTVSTATARMTVNYTY